MTIKTYSFRECTLTILDQEFGLQQVFASQALVDWLEADIPVTEFEQAVLRSYQESLSVNVDAWNEKELSQQFIGPLLGLARLTEPYRFKLFAERKIEAIVPGVKGDIGLSGEPDGIIATGYRVPQAPMFAFSEYKRELDPSGDPAGQALAAMLVGQVLNENQHPIYGAYIVGSEWRFMILEGKHYMISRHYSALTDAILDIFRILKALKQIVMALTA